jgi:catechol 1,2-dioxygenase
MAEGAGTAGRFDPNFTQNVINAMGPKTSPRLRQVMTSLIKHVHDFARETELTVDEWMAGVQLINWAGQMSTDRRNEGQLVCDVIGLESYVSPAPFTRPLKQPPRIDKWVPWGTCHWVVHASHP